MKYRLLGACAVAFCCAAPAFAQGLTQVEVLALQQQLRDDGCGVTHISGHMDGMTRSAVKKCGSKYSGATDARSMLSAMHIGFGNGNQDPSMSMARSGEGGSMSAKGDMDRKMDQKMDGKMGARMDRKMRRGMSPSSTHNSTMSHDSSMMKNGMMMKHGTKMKHDTVPKP